MKRVFLFLVTAVLFLSAAFALAYDTKLVMF